MKGTVLKLNIAAFNLSMAKSFLIKDLLSWTDFRPFSSFQIPYSISSRKKLSKLRTLFLSVHLNKSLLYSWLLNSRIKPSVKTAGVFYSFWLYCPASHRQYAITLRKIKDITQQWCMTLPSPSSSEAQHCSKAPMSR